MRRGPAPLLVLLVASLSRPPLADAGDPPGPTIPDARPPLLASPSVTSPSPAPVPQPSAARAATPEPGRGRPKRPPRRPHLSLLGTGAGVFGGTYLLNVVLGVAIDEPWLHVPVVGPLVHAGAFAERPDCAVPPGSTAPDPCASGEEKRLLVALMVLDSLVQATGVAMVVAGAILPAPPRDAPEWTLRPVLSPQLVGLVAAGRF